MIAMIVEGNSLKLHS